MRTNLTIRGRYAPAGHLAHERGCARAASPEAVEYNGQLDASRSNGVRRKEEDRPGTRVWLARNEDGDGAVAQRFGLNA